MELRYKTTFVDINENKFELEIYKEGYTGDSEELILHEDAINLQYELNDIFKPIKQSGASIRILTRGILKDLYTGKITDIKINIYKYIGNDKQLFWTGYNTPNNYNSPYSALYDETTVEAIDKLSALSYFKYKSTSTYKTFFEIIKSVLKYVNSDNEIKTIEYVNSFDDENGNTLNELKTSERNWYDEENEPSTCLEVLENICQFLGVTLTQYGDKLIMREVKSLQNGKQNKVTVYSLIDDTVNSYYETITAHTYECAENTCTVSLGDVYNQVNVIANMLDLNQTALEIGSDDSDLNPAIGGKYYNTQIIKNDDSSTAAVYFSTLHTSKSSETVTPSSFSDENPMLQVYSAPFSCFVRYSKITGDPYLTPESRPEDTTNLSFKNNLVFRIGNNACISQNYSSNPADVKQKVNALNGNKIFSKSIEPQRYEKGDWVVVSFNLNYTTQLQQGLYINDNVFTDGLELVPNWPAWYDKWKWFKAPDSIIYNRTIIDGDNVNYTINPFGLKCVLKIGDWYYCDNGYKQDGTALGMNDYYNQGYWTKTPSYFCICGSPAKGKTTWDTIFQPFNTNEYYKDINSDDKGVAVPIDESIFGEMTFEIYDCMVKPYGKTEIEEGKRNGTIPNGWGSEFASTNDKEELEAFANYCHIADLKIEHTYANDGDITSLKPQKVSDSDIKYSADIDLENVVEFSDITLNLNTYNASKYKQLSYSYVYNSDMSYLQTVNKNGVTARPEEHIVQMYVEHYQTPKLIYENTLKTDNIKPFDLIYVPYKPLYGTHKGDEKQYFINNYMVVGSINYSLTMDRINVKLYEM